MLNKVILIGNLTKDPELSETSSGVKFCKFGIAVNRPFANSDGEREVDFFNITTWRGQAEICARYLKKGKKVCVVGSLQNREYTDNNNVKRTATDVIASEIEFLSARSEDDERPAEKGEEPPKLEPSDDADLPF